MDIRGKLINYKALLKKAMILADEVDDARNATPKSPPMTGMPRGNHQTTLDLQMEIIESAQKRFDAAREAYLEELNEIEDLIDTIEDKRYRRALYFHYIYGWKWEKVAEKMHYSESSVRRFHAKALKEMERNA